MAPRPARRIGWLVLLVWLPLLAACAGPHPATPRESSDTDLDPSGRPYVGPPGPVSSMPPADNSANPLRCHPEGQGTVCTRTSP